MSTALPLPVTGQRRLPRVRYCVPVRISGDFSDREPVFVSLMGQLLDLGEGGMSVETPLELRIGSTIACSLRLGGRQAYFLGRVIWRHASLALPVKRIGVQFVAPSDADSSLVRHVVALGEHYTQRVYLRFEGRTDTISALARTHDSGVVLSAPLSILQQRTRVRFGFTADGPYYAGAVDATSVREEQGLLTLQVKIDVANEAARAFGQEVRARARALDEAAQTPVGIELPSRPPEPRGPRALLGSAAARAAALLLGALTALLLWRGPEQEGARARGEMPRSQASRASAVAPVAPAAQPAPAITAQPTLATAPRLLDPSYKWRSYKRELRIPIAGSGQGLRHYVMTAPAGLSIELPHAAPRTARSRYAVNHAGVTRLDVAARAGGGTRIRVWLADPPSTYAVAVSADAVTLRLPGR